MCSRDGKPRATRHEIHGMSDEEFELKDRITRYRDMAALYGLTAEFSGMLENHRDDIEMAFTVFDDLLREKGLVIDDVSDE